MSAVVRFEQVSIVFGNNPQSALPLMDLGQTRAEIQEKTDQILGVHDCSIDIPKGEILVLMGLSGSGKSTLLRSVNGLNPITRGQVKLKIKNQWVDIAQIGSDQIKDIRRQHVSMVFQQFGLLPWRTVRENIGFGLELAGLDQTEIGTRVQEQMELVGLSDWGDRRVNELSGGMQQRVGLARAFATRAPILLMDEPYSALDPLIRTRLQDELLGLQRNLQSTIIFVSHDLDEAFKIGDKIAIMEGGRIVQIGTPRDIYCRPVNEYVADFVRHMNPLNVLQVRDAMQPIGKSSKSTIEASQALRDALPRIIAENKTLTVIENGKPIGEITASNALHAMQTPPAERA